jgi:hypothetical protein
VGLQAPRALPADRLDPSLLRRSEHERTDYATIGFRSGLVGREAQAQGHGPFESQPRSFRIRV